MIKIKTLLVCVATFTIFCSILSSLGEKTATSCFPLNEKRWVRIFGDQDINKRVLCASFQPTEDGGYMLLLNRVSFTPSYKWKTLLCKLNKYGRIRWIKELGSSESGSNAGNDIEKTRDGKYIVVGSTTSYGARKVDVWLVKVDENGNEIWNKTIGGKEHDKGACIQQTIDGGYIIAGMTQSYGTSNYQKTRKWVGWIIKTDEDGNEIWNITFAEGSEFAFSSIIQTSDGGYAAVGDFIDLDSGKEGSCVIKLDENGSVEWKKTFTVGKWWVVFSQIIESKDGGYVIAGRKDDVGWVLKLDRNGNIVWDTVFGGKEDPETSIFRSIQQTEDDGYIVVGDCSWPKYEWIWRPLNPFYYTEGWMVKLDAYGKVEWKRVIRAPYMSLLLFDVKQIADGGFVVAGEASYTGPRPPRGSDSDVMWNVTIAYSDAFIMKTDSKGRTSFLQLKLSALIRCLTYWGITNSGISLS